MAKSNNASNFYDDMVSDEIISRELTFRGKTKTVYFKRLSAGERIAISRGQRMTLGGEKGEEGAHSNRTVEVDIGEALSRTHKFLMYANVDENGKRIFENEAAVGKLPEKLVEALQKLADEALADNDEENDLGNDSGETASSVSSVASPSS